MRKSIRIHKLPQTSETLDPDPAHTPVRFLPAPRRLATNAASLNLCPPPLSVPPADHHATLAQLFAEHGAYIWRVVRRMGVSDGEVDDLTQEVFLTAHRKLPEFEGRSSAKTWLYGICLRTVSDWRRRARVRREELVAHPPDRGADAKQPEDLERQRAHRLLDQALATLDEDQRAAFVLYEVEDLSLRRIAEITQTPLQTVYSRLKTARALMEEFFRHAHSTPAPRLKEGTA